MKGYVWNSNKIKALFVMLALGFIFLSNGATLSVHATESTFDGISNQKSGDLTWSITSDGKLTISGTGNYTRDSEDKYSGYNPSWYKYKDYISTAEVSVTGITSMERMFYDLPNLTTVTFDFSNTDTSQVTTMKDMFSKCSSLKTVDLSGLNTGNVEDMSYMFNMCTSLESLKVTGSGFNTAKVKTMYYMFASCSNLSALDVSGFNTSKVTNMGCMFAACKKIQTLNVSNFDTSNVTNMGSMFSNCNKLSSLTLGSNFKVDKVTYMGSMFHYCYALESIDLSSFSNSPDIEDADKNNMECMFQNCSKLTSIAFPKGFDTSNVTNMKEMFSNCTSLQSLDLSCFKTAAVEDMSKMFENCSVLQSIDVSNFDTGNVTNMFKMFEGCHAVTELDLSSFDTSGYVTDSGFVLTMDNLTKITTGQDKRQYKLVTKAKYWEDDKGNIYLDDTVIELASNTTLHIHSSTFDINYVYDGTLVGGSQTYDAGTGCVLSGYVTKEHYTFDGWYEDEMLTTKITEIPADRYGDITLYAKMTPVTYAITYMNVEGASKVEQLPSSYTYGKNLELSAPVKTCYQLEGWYSDKKLTQKVTAITPGTSGDIILYAKWTQSHDLDKENGVVTKEATTVTEGEICYTCKNCDYTETEKLPRIVTEESQITDETILNKSNDSDIKGSDFTKFQARADKMTKNSIRLKWNKIAGADGYKIYGNKCGKKNRYEFITNIKNGNKTKWTQKKLKKGTYYKYIVRAYKIVDGEEITLAVSKTIHATTTGGKYGVAKSVKIETDKKMKSKKGAYTLTIKKNKKYTIKASEVKGSKKIQKHRKIAFESSDKTIATVSSRGVVKGKEKGTCYIYAYAQNGVYKKIKVVVK